MIEFELTFDGGMAEKGLIEFYDASRALVGFQRSLALTTHLALHGEIITKAPFASGFEIYVPPFIAGSWKTRAKIIFGGMIAVGSIGKDSPVGQVVTSLYDAVLYNTMGFHVDYDKTLQQQFAETTKPSHITPEKIDSLCEKIESNIADMHRPIVNSKSATKGQVSECGTAKRTFGPELSTLTYDYIRQTKTDEKPSKIKGHVTSCNNNTYKGRIFAIDEQRPIPFELSDIARNRENLGTLTRSQHIHGQQPFTPDSIVEIDCFVMRSASGRVKGYLVNAVRTV